MRQKLHHGHRRTFRRNTAWKPIAGWILAAVILIPGGYFAARAIAGVRRSVPASETGSATTAPADTVTSGTTTTAPVPVSQSAYRGFTLPVSALRDTAALTDTCKKAVAAGFNCAVIELKDHTGALRYVSETEPGKTVGAAADALTLAAVTDAFAKMRAAGITPVAKLFAFEDAVAPRKLADAKVSAAGHTEWTWYDGDPNNGGKPWLNPYADAAQTYIAALAEELHTAGAGGIMLDGVYFPTQTAQADFTSAGNATLTKAQVLQQFMTRMNTLCDTPVFLCCSANAALGNTTAGYDTAPLSLGSGVLTPDLRLSALGKRVSVGGEVLPVAAATLPDTTVKVVAQLRERAAATEDGALIMPQLDTDTAKTMIAALKAVSGDASYLLHSENGSYDFSALV